MRETLAVSERRACRVLGQVRRTQRYTPRVADDEAVLTANVVSLACEYGRYGYRRITALLQSDGGEELLRSMAARWPFFDDLIGKIEMVCAKADLDVARLYVARLGGDAALLDELAAEFQRTVDTIRRIRGREHLLSDQPVLQASIALRNPYVDPLSLLQVSMLTRKRAAQSDEPEIDAALGTTLNGVAQGLRNTG